MVLSTTISRAGGSPCPPDVNTSSEYSRVFGGLEPWTPPGNSLEARLESLYSRAQDLHRRPARENEDIPAGYTYFAQFLNHDLSLDARLLPLHPMQAGLNHRTPFLDLDSVYGLGPEVHPHFYKAVRPNELLVGYSYGKELDLPRTRDTSGDLPSETNVYVRRRAIIPDPRNDENLLTSQLHLAFLRFHNKLIHEGASFKDAREQTRWHYQWLVVNDLLPRICGGSFVKGLTRKGRKLKLFQNRETPYLPLEFSVGAFRAGHSMIRGGYKLNRDFEPVPGVVEYPIFDLSPRTSLIGGRELPSGWTVQWDLFFKSAAYEEAEKQASSSGSMEVRTTECQFANRFGEHVDSSLGRLPIPTTDRRLRSLAYRTLYRSWQLGLPAGRDVAAYLKESETEEYDPLWIFVLKEAAESRSQGKTLGPIGARIVGEVIIGLLAADPASYYSQNRRWAPDGANGGRYNVLDFLKEAEMPVDYDSWSNRPR